MSEEDPESCMSCRSCAVNNEGALECRGSYPRASSHGPRWAEVLPTDWCRKWESDIGLDSEEGPNA